MFIRQLADCPEFTAGDHSILRELLHPAKQPINLRYSLAYAIVRPGHTSGLHSLTTSEVYYLLEGTGLMTIDGETAKVKPGDCIYIPPNAKQKIKNTGKGNLVFLCIVDPAWRKEDETIFNC